MNACQHPSIQRFSNDDGTRSMWACSDCRQRFYPACEECVTVGHRDAHERSAGAAPLPADTISENVAVFAYQHRMRVALAAFEVWAEAVIPMLNNAGDHEAADFGRDRIAQSQAAARLSERTDR